jgi:tRNA threonylcarbamoyladenosine biosynthesis protein TsaE
MTTCAELTTDAPAATEELGRRLAQVLAHGSVLALDGDLGTGKTILTRGLARGLGITEPVTSPTFTLVQEYRCPAGTWLFHLDLYRIRTEESALAIGIEEYLFRPDGITVIEWPDRLCGLLHSEAQSASTVHADRCRGCGRPNLPPLLWLHLEHVGPLTRRLRLPSVLAEHLAGAAAPAGG